MLISSRTALVILSATMAGAAAALLLRPAAAPWLGWVILGCGLASLSLLTLLGRPSLGKAIEGLNAAETRENDDITGLSPQRKRELVRGTSLHLREMNYRYSIRLDGAESNRQRPFMAEVNTVKLGFVPVVIIDNNTERQGYGYVAFVHDGKRWRGPGLPCPAGQVEAVRHAAKCVAPLAKEEETRF